MRDILEKDTEILIRINMQFLVIKILNIYDIQNNKNHTLYNGQSIQKCAFLPMKTTMKQTTATISTNCSMTLMSVMYSFV